MFGDHHRRTDGDGGRPLRIGNLFIIGNARFQGSDRLFQHFLIKLITHFFDMARLLIAQQIACATQIKIMGSQHKACPQAFE